MIEVADEESKKRMLGRVYMNVNLFTELQRTIAREQGLAEMKQRLKVICE